jgi:two-component system, chemotaxis family, response regulator Rcp1
MDGVDVIKEMQKDSAVKSIPVVVLAASPHDHALVKGFEIPANCFVVKPLTLERYLEAVLCFPHLGLSIVRINCASA